MSSSITIINNTSASADNTATSANAATTALAKAVAALGTAVAAGSKTAAADPTIIAALAAATTALATVIARAPDDPTTPNCCGGAHDDTTAATSVPALTKQRRHATPASPCEGRGRKRARLTSDSPSEFGGGNGDLALPDPFTLSAPNPSEVVFSSRRIGDGGAEDPSHQPLGVWDEISGVPPATNQALQEYLGRPLRLRTDVARSPKQTMLELEGAKQAASKYHTWFIGQYKSKYTFLFSPPRNSLISADLLCLLNSGTGSESHGDGGRGARVRPRPGLKGVGGLVYFVCRWFASSRHHPTPEELWRMVALGIVLGGCSFSRLLLFLYPWLLHSATRFLQVYHSALGVWI